MTSIDIEHNVDPNQSSRPVTLQNKLTFTHPRNGKKDYKVYFHLKRI